MVVATNSYTENYSCLFSFLRRSACFFACSLDHIHFFTNNNNNNFINFYCTIININFQLRITI